jgi:hypothetical protein
VRHEHSTTAIPVLQIMIRLHTYFGNQLFVIAFSAQALGMLGSRRIRHEVVQDILAIYFQ